MRITSPSNTTINGVTSKVVETGNGFLLNTQYYTKERLSAVALEFLKLTGSPYALSTNKQLFLQTSTAWRFAHDEAGIYKDSTHPNRYYVRIIAGYVESTTPITYLVTLEEDTNKELKCLNVLTINEGFIADFIDQDDTNVYITVKLARTVNIYTLNKDTFAFTSRWASGYYSNNYTNLTKIYSNDSEIHFMYLYDQNIYTLVFNKGTLVATPSVPIYRGQETTALANILTVLSDCAYDVNDDTSGLYLFNSADAEQPIDLYCYDRSKSLSEGFTMKPVEIIWNDKKSKIDFLLGTVSHTIRMFISEFDGVKYLNVVSYLSNSAVNTYVDTQGIYTFKIDSETQLTFTGMNPIDKLKQVNGFIYDASKEHVIVSKLNTFQVLKFSKESLTYETANYEVAGCYSVGLDELQRIWYIKTDNSVHMVNLEDAQSVNIEFEKEYYNYSGSSISTFITFSALNYLDQEFKGTFELVIDGPAVFTENETSTITIDYIGEGAQQVALTITGASPITIYPKFIKSI